MVWNDRLRSIFALMLIAPAPALGVWFALQEANGPIGTSLWFLAKAWAFACPLFWWLFIDKQRVSVSLPTLKHVFIGVIVGLSMFLLIITTYALFAKGQFDHAPMRELLYKAGLSSPLMYLAMAAYWSFGNSLIEEYIFRWFCFIKAEHLVGKVGGVIVSALIFTVHHTVALAFYVPWHLNALASIGVFFAAIIWSVLYAKTRNIWASYTSHVLADIAIFWIGFQLLYH